MKIKLDYSFIMEPAETWATKTGFNDFLAKAFKDAGLQAERVKTNLQDDTIIGELLIVSPIPSPVAIKEENPRSIRQIKDTLTKKRDDDGRFK